MCNIRSLFPRAHIEKKRELSYHTWSKAANLAVKSIEMYLKIMNEERRRRKKNRIDRPRSLLKWTTTTIIIYDEHTQKNEQEEYYPPY